MPGLVTAAGSLLNGVHLGKGGGQALQRGQEMEKAAPQNRLSISRLLNYTVEQAASKHYSLQELNITGGGPWGEKNNESCLRGAGSEEVAISHRRTYT